MRDVISAVTWPLAAIAFGATGGLVLAGASGLVSPLVAVGIVLGVIVAVVVMLSPNLGLILTAAVIPIEKLGRFGDDLEQQAFSLMRIVGLLALASLLLHMTLRRWRWICPLPVILYAGYYGICVLSLFYAYNPEMVKGQLATNLGNLLFLVLLVNGVRDWRMAKAMVWMWLFVTVIIALYQVYDWHVGNAINEHDLGKSSERFAMVNDSSSEHATIGNVLRAVGTSSSPAVYGINLILTLPFFMYLLRQSRKWQFQVLYVCCLVLILYNMFLTNTRGVNVFGALTLLICILFGLLRITLLRVAALAVLAASLLVVTPQAVWERSLDPATYTVEKSDNLRARFALWDAALRAGMEHWATGIGVGDRTTIIKYTKNFVVEGNWITPHNAYLYTFLEVGIFGWLLFFGFVFLLLGYTIQSTRLYRQQGDHDHYWFSVACVIATLSTVLFAVHVDVFHFPLKGWWLVAGLSYFTLAFAKKHTAVTSQETRSYVAPPKPK